MIRHDARSKELTLTVFMGVENALEHEITFRRRQLATLARGERDHVFGPRTLKVRQVAAGVLGFGCA